jgi:transcriptional regulator with XRE-family HTH domain
VNSVNARSPPPPAPAQHFGTLLREWRAARRLSQLDLALEAGVSARHLSCLETGKAQASHEMVVRLADALDMPLRERNALLVAAGYAPRYRESALATPQMLLVHRAIQFILEQQEPYPAFVTNRYWDVVLSNRAMVRILGRLMPARPRHTNVLRQIFDPDDMRPIIGNWEEVAGDAIRHLHEVVAATPSDARGRALLDELLAYPGVPQRWRAREPGTTPLPLMTTVLRSAELELRFFSTLTTFATPHDVTLEELRIECMFAADEPTAAICRSLAG